MCRCKLHHSIYSWKLVVQTDHTYCCFLQVQTSLQAWTYYIYKIIYIRHRNKVWSCLTLSDFFFLVHYSLQLFSGVTILITYTCACADIACLSILHISSYFWTIYRTFLAPPFLAIRKAIFSSSFLREIKGPLNVEDCGSRHMDWYYVYHHHQGYEILCIPEYQTLKTFKLVLNT